MGKKKVRWGILGCAAIAESRVIPSILKTDNASLYAIAGRNQEKVDAFALKFQPEITYCCYEELLADPQVDAVYIPLPNSLHYEWVLKAAEAKKHILCEKPLALNAKEAAAMFGACKKNGVLLMEAYAYRHAPLVKKVKELLDSKIIGDVRLLESTHANHDNKRGNIRTNKNLGGGCFYDLSSYNISLANYLMEEDPKIVHANVEMSEEFDVDEVDSIFLSYENGVHMHLFSAINSYPKGCFSVLGEKGRIDVANKFNSRGLCTVTVGQYGHGQNVEIVDEVKTAYTIWCEDNYLLEIQDFCNNILEGDPIEVSEEESMRNARVMDLVREAAGV